MSSTATTPMTNNVILRIIHFLSMMQLSSTATTCLGLILSVLILSANNVESRAMAATSNTTTTNSTKHRLIIGTNSIMRQVEETQSSNDHNRSLKKVFLSNRTVTCNDGSQAGFYLRKSAGSKKWVVFLEGGWHCYDTKSCKARWMKLRHLMTSYQWPEFRNAGGILSGVPEENPYWHNANHVLVPYCSSDSWSGTKARADDGDSWRFMGSLIIRQVIADLIPLGLGRGSVSELLLVGSSAGGLGVMLNLDRINHFLHHEKNLKVLVRGVSDSGWFLDREPFAPAAIGSSEAVRQGWKLWEGQLPEACVKQHKEEPWRCYFGYRLYPTLESPLFVFQWLFDEAQMRADNVGAPVTPQQWNYIHEMGGALRSSLENVSAVFAPSCIGHAVLSKRDWVNIKIDDVSLPKALRCWEKSTRRKRINKLRRATETSIIPSEKRKKHNQRHKHPEQQQQDKSQKNHRLTKEEREQRRKHNQQRKRNNQNNNKNPRRVKTQTTMNPNRFGSLPENGTHTNRLHKNRRKHQHEKVGQKNQHKKNHNGNNNNKRRRKQQQLQQEQPALPIIVKSQKSNEDGPKQKCSLRYLERCSWPQCNHSCPTLTNPATGEEMRFLELLTSFGLDIETVATALGVDMQTLINMDRTELVNLLTQQVS
ncbi:palmitoleoyl-protein carboxylesterase NOTUM [Eupeodes corollae]|uniref:palmitoleoyl-protein carboxylesterase NOTUM n=1 Tax=Eupeodes corollae TaxID=290404 RepID=UPI0024911C39|nr:palmitoleoyl-protein carboxylesterase NOTUM [Eupeodes corollae]